METINTYYEDYISLEKFVKNNHELLLSSNTSAVMAQIFSGICDENNLIAISKQIRELIPGSQVIGTTTSGEIMNGLVSGLKTVLSFSVFRHSSIKAAFAEMKDGNDYELGRSIAATLNSDKAQVLILFTTGPTLNAGQLLEGVQSVNAGLPVAGGSAGNNRRSTKRFVCCNENATDCGVVGAVLEGDHLTVSCHSHLGWQPIGKEMIITKADGSRVYTIDHIPAFQVYRRYLGIGPTSDIMDVVEFPMIICKNGLEIARSPALRHDDDSIGFFGDMAEGDKVRFSFGHVDMIIEKMDNLLQMVKQQPVQSIFVYSCASRRGFLQESSQIETLPLQDIAPTAGFFTSGEFFHADNSNQLLNATMTTLVLSESAGTKLALVPEPEAAVYSIQTNTEITAIKDNCADRNIEVLKRLTHLINTVTGELNERTAELEAANQTVNDREERLRLVLDGSTDGFWDWNIETGVIYRSRHWIDILGYSGKEIEPNLHTWEKVIHPDDIHPTMRALNEYLAGQTPKYETEYRLLTQSGELKWILERGSVVLRNQNGEPLRIAGTCTDITERKRMEESLRLSDEKFSKAFNCNPDPITITTVVEGRYVEINDAWLKYTGYQRDEAINHTSSELSWAVPGERDLIIKNIVEYGRIRNIETRFNNKSGEVRTALLSAEKIDMGGKPHLLFVTKDITDLKKTEVQLQEERNFNAALLDTAGTLIAVCDQEGRIVVFNQICEQITGYKAKEAKGRYIWEMVHSPKDVEDYKALFDQNSDWKTPGVKQEYENYWITKDGKRRLIGWTITGLFDEKGQNYHAIGMGIDITEQRITEERLRESEAKLRSIYENANGIIFTISQEGILTFVSHGWTKLLGHDINEVEGYSYTSLIHPDDVALCTSYFEKVMATGESLNGIEYRVKHKKGTWRWVKCNGACVMDEAGNNLYGVGIAEDITERIEAEAEIRYLSYHDKLTGLYNRTFFEEELKRINTNRQLPIGLIIGDVNGLKLINDALGHQEGDKVLIKAAEILRNSCRQEDILSRWGGDEFIILLPQCDSILALRIFKRINESFIGINSLPIPINMSLGMAIKNSLDKDISDVIKEAEEKMYRNKLLENRSTRSAFIKSLEKTLWERSHETKEHCQRLQEMAQKIGRTLHLNDSELDNLKLLAALHDIGKIAIPNSILDKPGRLSPEEWETIKNHSEIGYRIALSSPELAPIAEAILHHHECWDGSGYPLGLKGEKIPLISRIIAITDAYDVMVNGRPYKKAVSKGEALAEIERCAGTQFDPELVREGLFFD
ncbi:MAG TPA: PAS domain S-box protein [Syntrophomonadaceae bacterium]|nr:PAS domain S-box protein [Syntrophomonadaceae bacterium]